MTGAQGTTARQDTPGESQQVTRSGTCAVCPVHWCLEVVLWGGEGRRRPVSESLVDGGAFLGLGGSYLAAPGQRHAAPVRVSVLLWGWGWGLGWFLC